MSEERETRLFMISPDSTLTPDQLVRMVHAYGEDVIVKETCYGCLVQGTSKKVREILARVREGREYEIFSKIRAYPSSDPRRCRAQHGTRPGYAQLEAEWQTLPVIQYGLIKIMAGEKYDLLAEKPILPVEVFKKICEESK